MKATVVCLALAALVAGVAAQPPGSNPGNCVSANPTGVIPQKIAVESYKYTENLYKWSDEDLLQFTLNGECLEANFDTCAAFGRPLTPDLEATADGSVSLGGCRKANLKDPLVQLWAEEVARNEAGHNRLLRERLRQLGQEPIPCPPVDIEGGFTTFINNAMNKTGDEVVAWDPYKSDLHFLISTATLEYVGATGDQGLVLFMKDKVNAALMGGLATSAYSHTAADHALLWRDINTEVPEFGVPVSYLFDAISKYRDSLDGVVNLDQGLVFAGGINLAPTDGNGAGLARLPQQVVNIFQCGQEGSGCFFPEGFSGPVKTNKPVNIPTIPKEWIVAANTPPAVTFKVEPALQNTSAPWDGTSAFAIVGGPEAMREVPDPAINETLSGEQFSLVPSTEGMEDGGGQEGGETPGDGGSDDGGMDMGGDGGMDMGGGDMSGSGSGVITIGPLHPGKIFLKKIGRKLRSVA